MSWRTLIGADPHPAPLGPDRREVLRLLALAGAAAAAGCGRPRDVIVPHVDQNGVAASGAPARYATALELSGYARGVLGVVADDRPIKVDGNPRHPASLGSTDVFMEAAVLDLFDPQRSKLPMQGDVPADWRAVSESLARQLATHRADRGAGLAVLTGRILSPTTLRQVDRLQAAFPAMLRARWEPIHDDAEVAGLTMAYGRPLDLSPRLEEADVVLCLDADPLGPGPDQIRLARGFAHRRRPEAGPMSRVYVVESSPTASGVMADQRLAASPAQIHDLAIALAAALGGPYAAPPLPPELSALARQAARDLQRGGARGLVLVGRSQAPEIHALAAWINGQVRAPLDTREPLDPVRQGHAASLAALAEALHDGKVRTLLALDSDPLYGAPPALGLKEVIRKASYSLHAGLYRGETGRATTWHAPLSHAFESWSDARAVDGTPSLVQPLVAPLYDTRTLHALLADAAGAPSQPDLERVQDTWRDAAGADLPGWWRSALATGVAGPASTPAPPPPATPPKLAPAAQASGLALVLRPSAQVWDGRFAANAWLQECPEPVSKETWGASLTLSPADAARLKLADGQAVSLGVSGAAVAASVRIEKAQAQGAVGLPMGFGHQALGPVADGVGCRVVALRGADQGFVVGGVTLAPGGRVAKPPALQHAFALAPDQAQLFPLTGPNIAKPKPEPARPDLLHPKEPAAPAWAMTVDTSICIGCNACVVACQSENNIPVIGPDDIGRQRDMHWLRVDRYETPSGHGGFQPVPCMQCEEAPCEPVCPVEASVHDDEGLNDQVYNRCIGTRFCEANCPYKVRRFNFRDYQTWPVFGPMDQSSIQAQRNPEVSVRARGVMEKCTYCVQRLSAARRQAEKEGRAIRDGEATTACQDACPTRAISFGNMADASAAVNGPKHNPRHYVLLEELKTRPRTTHLARAVNPPTSGEGAA